MEDYVTNIIIVGVISWASLLLLTRKIFPNRSFEFCNRIVFTIHASIAVILASRSVKDWRSPVSPPASQSTPKQDYIIYMGSLQHGDGQYKASFDYHAKILHQVLINSTVQESLIRRYHRSFNGFAAKLTDAEKNKLSEVDGIVSIFPSRTYKLTTTRSWDFMNFTINPERNLTVESNVIIGVLDSGIWPESESFKDDGLGPIPERWKGVCEGGTNFTCNKKLIGARYYDTWQTARDQTGHGSHTASIVAGRIVNNTNFLGLAQGNARGGVPSARIAAYKVCDNKSCEGLDILKGFDDAIADGVDIISVSIGYNDSLPLFVDSISIGAFHAALKGILTAQSAGNSGPHLGSVTSIAPWLFTVAASSTDRRIIDKVILGNGSVLVGSSIHNFTIKENISLIIGAEAQARNCTPEDDGSCRCLNETMVKDKLVICDVVDNYTELNGALGFITKTRFNDDSVIVPFPEADLVQQDIDLVLAYKNSTADPVATLTRSEAVPNNTLYVASFSSRGPNKIVPDILKPDVTAPGSEILAAFSPLGKVTSNINDKRSVEYIIWSGTSMSTPHAAGAAAYVKALHPEWSPSAIKSAIMTTAWHLDSNNSASLEFGFGSGHIDPFKAANPGLVYETTTYDYINFLCGLNYEEAQIIAITGRENITCSETQINFSAKELNYPSMTATVDPKEPFKVIFPRTVTNVGLANTTYNVTWKNVTGLTVTVEPSTLQFDSLQEKKSFVVTVSGEKFGDNHRELLSTSLKWSNGTCIVRSPIVIYPTFKPPSPPLSMR